MTPPPEQTFGDSVYVQTLCRFSHEAGAIPPFSTVILISLSR